MACLKKKSMEKMLYEVLLIRSPEQVERNIKYDTLVLLSWSSNVYDKFLFFFLSLLIPISFLRDL